MQAYLKLNDGTKIPQFGLGVYQVPEGETTYNAVLDALKMGVRHIDTAHAYQNERSVGRAVKDSGIPRKEIWITSKLWPSEYGEGKTEKAIDKMLSRLDTDYIDLLLLHQQFGDYIGAWRAMEELYKEGRIRAIGVCNFYPHVLADFCETVEVIPAVNQVELHPFFQQENALKLMKEYEVTPEAWGPFAEGKHGIFSDPVLTGIGAKYGKSAAQVVLRWNVQRGVVVIPKSVHRERMEQNIGIWNFTLSDEDMAAIAKMDIGHSEIVDHFDPNFVKALHGRFK